jgi:hypothetical protein
MQKAILAAASLATAVTASYEEHPSYDAWLASPLGKKHPGRRFVYEANLKKIKAHNAKHAQGKVSWKMGVNKFTALTVSYHKRRRPVV